MGALVAAAALAAGVHTSALPPAGIAVETQRGVVLVDLAGHVRRVLPGWQFSDYGVARLGQVELRDRAGHAYELRAGVLARVPAGTVTLAGGYVLRQQAFPGAALDVDASGSLLSIVRAGGVTEVRDLRTGRRTSLRPGCRAAGAIISICGYPYATTEESSIVRDGRTLAGAVGAGGWWQSVVPSPDGGTLLAQWQGQCDTPTAYLIDARTGQARLLAGGREALTLGWSGGRALVFLPQGACGTGTEPPGVYSFDLAGRHRLVYRVPPDYPQVRLWLGGNS